MANTLSQAVSSFSQKFSRFRKSPGAERTVPQSENEVIQRQLRERIQRLTASVAATYRIYKSPFEALGKNSDRAAGIDRDEQQLLKAYNLYKSVLDIQKEDEEGDGTFISRVEIATPLKDKAGYTSGGQFIYLVCWLHFEQGMSEFIPFFTEKDGAYSLAFARNENFEFEEHDKEIFEIIRQEFYS